MKRTIIAAFMLLTSALCFGQAKDSTVQIGDTTPIISLIDLQRLDARLKERLIFNQYNIVMQELNNIVQEAAAAYQKKNKPKK